jgi:radical SAM protein with 4Fe4S-binding SPASM domain
MGANSACQSCGIAGNCGKGCPAAVIAAGQRIGAVDTEVCPVISGKRRLLPLMPA